MSLKWEDVDGYLMMERAVKNGFTYIRWYGTDWNRYYVDIYKGVHDYDSVKMAHMEKHDWNFSGDRNYGSDNMYEYAEKHARRNRFPWLAKLMEYFKW